MSINCSRHRGGILHVVLGLLGEGVLGNGLEGLLNVDVLLGRGLKVGDVALGLAPGEGALLEDLQQREGRLITTDMTR